VRSAILDILIVMSSSAISSAAICYKRDEPVQNSIHEISHHLSRGSQS